MLFAKMIILLYHKYNECIRVCIFLIKRTSVINLYMILFNLRVDVIIHPDRVSPSQSNAYTLHIDNIFYKITSNLLCIIPWYTNWVLSSLWNNYNAVYKRGMEERIVERIILLYLPIEEKEQDGIVTDSLTR